MKKKLITFIFLNDKQKLYIINIYILHSNASFIILLLYMLQRKTTFKKQNRKRFKINLNKNNLYKNRIYNKK